MKPLIKYKSLLLAGGLLLICLTTLHSGKMGRVDSSKPANAGQHTVIAKCGIDPDGGSYIKDIAGKLFPVLKSLNLM